MMNTQQVRQFRERWQAVAAVERAERQAASMEQRWRQLNAIVRLAMGLQVTPKPDEDPVYQRWADLRRRMGEYR